MGALSHDQFAAKVNAGGASRLLHTHEEPTAKPGAYAVGLPGHESVYTAPIVREQVEKHASQLLADPTVADNPAAMQGGWRDKAEVFLDHSQLVQGRRSAVAQGKAGAQLAIYDMAKDRDVHMKHGRAHDDERVKAGTHKVVGNRSVGYTVEPRRR